MGPLRSKWSLTDCISLCNWKSTSLNRRQVKVSGEKKRRRDLRRSHSLEWDLSTLSKWMRGQAGRWCMLYQMWADSLLGVSLIQSPARLWAGSDLPRPIMTSGKDRYTTQQPGGGGHVKQPGFRVVTSERRQKCVLARGGVRQRGFLHHVSSPIRPELADISRDLPDCNVMRSCLLVPL